MGRTLKPELDLVGGAKARITVRVDLGDGPRTVELLEPRRREARALSAVADAASRAASDGGGYVDALYATACAVLSRNSDGTEFEADQVADALSIKDAERLVAAYARLKEAQEGQLGNA